MQNRKLMICATLFMNLGVMGSKAQSLLNVRENSGNSSTFYTNDIRKLTFSDGNVNVIEFSGSSSSYTISGIKRLDFNGLSTDVQFPKQNKQSKNGFELYPNPVNDILNIKGEIVLDHELKIEILDMQGKVHKKEVLTSLNGINVSNLKTGMYICRIYNSDKIENIKFLKN